MQLCLSDGRFNFGKLRLLYFYFIMFSFFWLVSFVFVFCLCYFSGEKNSLLPNKWTTKLFAARLEKNSFIHRYWPFKSWLIMKNYFVASRMENK